MSPVVFHDDTVDRVTQATGHISSHTHSNLKKLNLATKHPLGSSFEFSGIPDLEEFVAECMKLNMKMIIDLKTYEVPEETISVILNLYKKFPGMKSCTLVTSFFPHLLYQLRRKDPEIVCSLSYRPHFFAFSTYEGTNVSMKPRYNIFIINNSSNIISHIFSLLFSPDFLALCSTLLTWWISCSPGSWRTSSGSSSACPPSSSTRLWLLTSMCRTGDGRGSG